ncbi:hypothetical protein [Nitrosopumilus sp.]|uniref:hypothetical protein n=1 Tax=Nitrosopumilus sp. TaxID=2024843 RepID=UPI003B59E89A
MSHSDNSCINQGKSYSPKREVSSFPHPATFVGLCHRCWASNVIVALSKSDEILCNKCFGASLEC